MREVVLDTETTGLEVALGHRIIEIGCVEIRNRRLTGNHYHVYLQPDREIDAEAGKVHGITAEYLADKPRFDEVADEFLAFVRGARLVIHNAPFDVGFLNNELQRSNAVLGRVDEHCSVLDTLSLARRLFPGQRATLDALCKRYGVDNSKRDLHGALLDAEILADVYLLMTSGQESLALESARDGERDAAAAAEEGSDMERSERLPLRVQYANPQELKAHERYLELLDAESGGKTIWRALDS